MMCIGSAPAPRGFIGRLKVCLFSILALLAWSSGTALSGAAKGGGPPPGLTTICGAEEQGERLEFRGRVLDYEGRPLAKAAVVAYHTDRSGLYNPRGGTTRVPRLRGVAITDPAGRFGFVTIRPGPYPDGDEPAHIHVTVTAPAHHVRHLEYWFRGDPRITPSRRERAIGDPSIVIVDIARNAESAWTFSHEIRLDAN